MQGRKSVIVVSLLVWFTGIGLAQVRSGSTVGLVVDPSGAPVPDATVSVLALDTNIKSETKTNVSGEYMVPYLPPGQPIDLPAEILLAVSDQAQKLLEVHADGSCPATP
jgi:hypothetical protein